MSSNELPPITNQKNFLEAPTDQWKDTRLLAANSVRREKIVRISFEWLAMRRAYLRVDIGMLIAWKANYGGRKPQHVWCESIHHPQGQLAKEVHKGKGWTTRMATLEKRQVLFQLSLTRSETS